MSDDKPFWEKGRKFPHNYEVYKDGACSYGCGCRIGPYMAYGPDGVHTYGECPNHPDRPNMAELMITVMNCKDENTYTETLN